MAAKWRQDFGRLKALTLTGNYSMAHANKQHTLDRDKLLENSLSSIRLGIADYKLAFEEKQHQDRVLSSLRNLFSGILLLFKYKISIAVDSPEDAAELIYKTSKAQPLIDESGKVIWRPKFLDTTIEIEDIKIRFNMLKIDVNFDVIDQIRKHRNELEHLHPQSNLGKLTTLISDIFPILRDFINKQLNKNPAQLLGETWNIMLELNSFYIDTRNNCLNNWKEVGIPALMLICVPNICCEACASDLITPHPQSVKKSLLVKYEPNKYQYTCLECKHNGLIAPLLIEQLGNEFWHNPFDGDPLRVLTCIDCDNDSFISEEDKCYWCEYERRYKECLVCYSYLSVEEQEFRGLCSYHAHSAFKDD